MWKEAVRALETGIFAEISLLSFFIAFVLIVIYALTLSRRDCEEALHMPLDDAPSVGGDGAR